MMNKETKNYSKEKIERIKKLLNEERDILEEEEIQKYEEILKEYDKEEQEENGYEEMNFDFDTEDYYEVTAMREIENQAILDYPYTEGFRTEKEKLDCEKVLKSNVRKFYNSNKILRKRFGSKEDLENEVRCILLERFKKWKKENPEASISNLALFKTIVVNILIDIKRHDMVHYNLEDPDFDMLQADDDDHHKITGEERLYKESETAKTNCMDMFIEDSEVSASEIVKSIMNDEEFQKLPKLRKERAEKFIFANAVYNARLSSKFFIDKCKAYEDELDEEKKEILAEGVSYKEQTGYSNLLTDDVLLQTFMGIRTGVNAGNAGTITRDLPQLLHKIYLKQQGNATL